jgi:hypothetical protein
MSDSFYRSCSVTVRCKAWSCWVYKLFAAAAVISLFVIVHSLYCDVNCL